jgi:hypothetical protein
MVAAIAGACAALSGAWGLRNAWAQPGRTRVLWTLTGWALFAASLALWRLSGWGEAAIAFWLTGGMVLAYALVVASLSMRARKKNGTQAASLDPARRPTRPWRAALRFLTAGLVSGVAALLACAAYVVLVPGVLIDRVAAAAFLLPLLWGAAMAWTLSDSKLVRPAVGLAVVVLFCAGLAFLPNVAP